MQHSYLIICDDRQKSYFSQLNEKQDFRFILSEAEFEGLVADEVASYHWIIVFAALLWQDRKYTDFYGIDIAVLLRLKLKALAPVCMLSFLPKNYFGKLNETKYNILKARGTCFRQLPINFADAENAASSVVPLSAATLTYLSTLLIDIRHIVDTLRHDLRMEADNSKVCSSLKKIEQLSSTNIYHKLQELAEEIASAHYESNADNFYSLTKELISTLNIHSQNVKQDTPPADNTAQCKVLLLDDNTSDLNWAKDALSPYFEIIPFQDAPEAKAYIEQDTKNELLAVICDWQLLKPNSKEHQELLGFEVLDFASKHGFYALFSLTSTDDFSIREVDAHLNFEHLPIAKDFQQGEALWKTYIPVIQQKIDRTLTLIASLPTGEAWSNNFKLDYKKENGQKAAYKKYFKSFKEQYIEKRNSIDWHLFENEISAEAVKLWQYYGKSFDEDARIDIFDLKTQWGLELNRELKSLLIIRRLYFAFWFNKMKLDISFKVSINGEKMLIESPVINIYSVLKKRYFEDMSHDRKHIDDEKTYRDLNNAAKVFVSQLCIEPNNLPQGILPEEKAWLQSQNIDINRGNDNLYD
jgi:hypothetical protein